MGQPEGSERLGGGRQAATPARKKLIGVTPIKRKEKEVYRIAFSYKGVQCRELLALPHSKANDTYCSRLRAEILGRIAREDFVYTDYFPDSEMASRFGGTPKHRRLLRTRLEEYRERARKTMETSTFGPLERDIDRRLIPWAGERDVTEVTRADLRALVGLQTCSLKRVRNMLMPLRAVLAEAANDGEIEVSPFHGLDMARLVSPAQRTPDYKPNPYKLQELMRIFARISPIERLMYQFWTFTGIRTSELVGLRWTNVDLVAGTVRIVEVTTAGKDKPRTKTPSGTRTIPLLPAALQAAREMWKLTGPESGARNPEGRFAVNPRARRRDPFFLASTIERTWKNAHAGTGVEVRNPYQLRHTFASYLLSQGANPAYIARLLGHTDTEMVTRVYGRWIEEGERLGFTRVPQQFGMEELCVKSE